MECDGCGAALEPNDMACRYCRRAAPWAAQRQAEEKAREAKVAAEQQAATARVQAASREELDRVSKRALVLSLVGTVLCLFPITSIFAIVSYLRAKKLAKAAGVDVPGSATIGFVLSVFYLVASPVFLTWAIVRDNALEDRATARIKDLETQVAPRAQAWALELDTACKLAELYAIKNGLGEDRGKNLVNFDCGGKLEGSATRMMLPAFSFSNDVNDKRIQVAACLERGDRWFVKGLSTSGTCAP